jgi:hypothetical protein
LATLQLQTTLIFVLYQFVEYPNFGPDSIPDDEAAIDLFNFGDTFLCSFTSVLFIPYSVTEDWARAFSLVCKNLMDACALPPSDPTRRQRIIRWSLWYSGLPPNHTSLPRSWINKGYSNHQISPPSAA